MGKIINALSNPNFATKFAKNTAITVYFMTAVKAGVRPAFIMADKKNDKETKKYTAAKEVLYQVLCIIMAAALMPIFERGGLALAERNLSKLGKGLEGIKKISDLGEFKELADLKGIDRLKKVGKFRKAYLSKAFNEEFISKVQAAKDKKGVNLTEEDFKILRANQVMHFVNGGVETGSFIASILGLTILAPMISHEILHPILHAVGLGKKHDDDKIGQPNEVFLADAKVPVEDKKASKLNANA